VNGDGEMELLETQRVHGIPGAPRIVTASQERHVNV
jgi:hypothetical protein